jgi:hypothetical protein
LDVLFGQVVAAFTLWQVLADQPVGIFVSAFFSA